MVNIGFLLFIGGLVLAWYLPSLGIGWVSIFIAAATMSFGGLLMQTKDGKLLNLYYRESVRKGNHMGGIAYLIKVFGYSMAIWGVVTAVVFFIFR